MDHMSVYPEELTCYNFLLLSLPIQGTFCLEVSLSYVVTCCSVLDKNMFYLVCGLLRNVCTYGRKLLYLLLVWV